MESRVADISRVILLDTNILIGFLAGDERIAAFILDARTRSEIIAISVISEIELLASPAMEPGDEVVIERLLTTLEIITLNGRIGRRAAEIRRRTKFSLGDAVIAATADLHLNTRDTRSYTANARGRKRYSCCCCITTCCMRNKRPGGCRVVCCSISAHRSFRATSARWQQ